MTASASPLAALLRRREISLAALIVLTFAAVGLVNPTFLSSRNGVDLLLNAAPIAVIACGVTLVILTAEIDISVGSLLGLLAAVMGLLGSPTHAGWPVVPTILATLAIGGGVGLINGLLVTLAGVPSIIVTLGMLTLLRGSTELLMAGENITNLPAGLRFFGTGAIAGVPVSIIVATIISLLTIGLTIYTPLGRRIYAVGSNASAARLAGVSPTKIKIVVFTITGLLVAVATLLDATRISTIESGIGRGRELLVVTCVVVGGTAISGGRGSIAGTLLGVLLMVSISTVLIFLKLGLNAAYWERAVQGGFILLAVLADHLSRRTKGAG